MTELDPYYLRRGIRRPLPENQKRETANRRIHDERQKKQRDDAETDQNGAEALLDIVAAQSVEILQRQLDRLEAANTAALMRNTEEMDAVRERIFLLLEQAFVLPDGRRVFKTEDGSQVFDEDGNEVEAEVIDPDAIPDHHPKWEAYRDEREAEAALSQQRETLLERQGQIDEARISFDKGALDQSELDDLEAEFGAVGLDDAASVTQRPANEIGRVGSNPTLENNF